MASTYNSTYVSDDAASSGVDFSLSTMADSYLTKIDIYSLPGAFNESASWASSNSGHPLSTISDYTSNGYNHRDIQSFDSTIMDNSPVLNNQPPEDDPFFHMNADMPSGNLQPYLIMDASNIRKFEDQLDIMHPLTFQRNVDILCMVDPMLPGDVVRFTPPTATGGMTPSHAPAESLARAAAFDSAADFGFKGMPPPSTFDSPRPSATLPMKPVPRTPTPTKPPTNTRSHPLLATPTATPAFTSAVTPAATPTVDMSGGLMTPDKSAETTPTTLDREEGGDSNVDQSSWKAVDMTWDEVVRMQNNTDATLGNTLLYTSVEESRLSQFNPGPVVIDNSVPTTVTERQVLVKLMIKAMKDLSLTKEGPRATDPWRYERLPDEQIERGCWELLVSVLFFLSLIFLDASFLTFFFSLGIPHPVPKEHRPDDSCREEESILDLRRAFPGRPGDASGIQEYFQEGRPPDLFLLFV